MAAIANGVVVGNAQGGFEAAAGTASADLSLEYAIASANYQYAIAVAESGYQHGASLGGGGHTASLATADNNYRLSMSSAMVTWTGAVSPAKGQLHIDEYSSAAWTTYNIAEQAATDARAAEELGYAIDRAEDVGDAQEARATAIGDAYVAYVTEIANAQIAYSFDMATARSAYVASYVTAEKARVDAEALADTAFSGSIAGISRDWIAAAGAADVALEQSVGVARVSGMTTIANAEATFQIAIAADNATTVASWAAAEQTAQADFEAAYYQAYSDWLSGLASDFTAFVVNSTQADVDYDVAYLTALAAWDDGNADARVDFVGDTALDVEQYTKDTLHRQFDYVTDQTDNQNALDGARSAADAALMIARAEVARLRLINDAQTEEDYQIDTLNGDPNADDNRDVAEANDEPDYEQMLADAEKVWKDAYAGAELAYHTSQATDLKSLTVALSGMEKTYSIAVAADQEVYDIAIAAAELTARGAVASAGNDWNTAIAAAEADYFSADLDQSELALATFATTLATPWAQFQADRAAAVALWWADEKPNYLAWNADDNAAGDVYQGVFSAQSTIRSAAYAAADEALSLAEAGAFDGWQAAFANATETYTIAMAILREAYSTDLADADRDHRVGGPTALRDLANGQDAQGNPFTQTEYDNTIGALSDTRDGIIDSAKPSYAVGSAEAEGDFNISVATANRDYALVVGPAFVTWQAANGDADVAFSLVESPAAAQMRIDLANIDGAYVKANSQSYADAMSDFAVANSSPWAQYEADREAADATWTDAVADAYIAIETSIADADSDYEIAFIAASDTYMTALAQATTDRAIAMAEAQIDKAVADKAAAVDMAANGASDALFPEGDSPFTRTEQTRLTAAATDAFFTLPAADAASNFASEMFQTKAEEDHATPPGPQRQSDDALDERKANGQDAPSEKEAGPTVPAPDIPEDAATKIKYEDNPKIVPPEFEFCTLCG